MTHTMNMTYRSKKQVIKLMAGSTHTLFMLMSMALLLMVGMNTAWAQEPDNLSGTYFIASQNSKGTKYNASSSANNFYLVPAADPQVLNKQDAFYSSDYNASYGDPEMPFLTTANTNLDANSAWKITKTGDDGYYTIQHVVTRKYVVYEPPHSDKPNRKSMHLLTTDDPGEIGLFDIQPVSGVSNGFTIRPQSIEEGNRFFNPANTNYNDYHGHDGDYNSAG